MRRVGIVGAGLIGSWHAARWQQLPVQLVGFYDHTPEHAQRAARTFGGEAFGTLEALLAAVDLVDICTPTFAHKEAVLAAASNPILEAIICEKPIARRLRDAETMIEACEAANVPLFIAHVVRFFPQYARAKALQDAGDLGRPGVLRTVRAGSFPRPDPDTWYSSFTKGGGVVMDLSIHDLDFARWLFGEVERVFARGLTFAGESRRDHALITLRFKNGAIGHIEGSWASPPGQFRTALEVAGEGTLLEWDSGDPSPFLLSVDAAKTGDEKVPGSDNPLVATDDPYYLELKHVLDCLDAKKPFLVSPRDGLMALKLSLAVIESIKTGQPVTVDTFAETDAETDTEIDVETDSEVRS